MSRFAFCLILSGAASLTGLILIATHHRQLANIPVIVGLASLVAAFTMSTRPD